MLMPVFGVASTAPVEKVESNLLTRRAIVVPGDPSLSSTGATTRDDVCGKPLIAVLSRWILNDSPGATQQDRDDGTSTDAAPVGLARLQRRIRAGLGPRTGRDAAPAAQLDFSFPPTAGALQHQRQFEGRIDGLALLRRLSSLTPHPSHGSPEMATRTVGRRRPARRPELVRFTGTTQHPIVHLRIATLRERLRRAGFQEPISGTT